MKKLLNTLRIASNLICARTFGKYCYSGWNSDIDYAVYEWRGERYMIPMSVMEKE